MVITDLHVKETCKPGQQEKTCKYLSMGSEGWFCIKNTALQRTIDARIDMVSKADNCDGFLELELKGVEA